MSHAAASGERTEVPHRHRPSRVSLQRLDIAWLDRILPARPGPFVAVVSVVCAALWVAGLLLAESRARFLADPEWQVMPLYLAVHLVIVRLFVSAYAGDFLAGCKALVMDPGEAERRARRVLGPLGFGVALLLAAPLAAMDVMYIHTPAYVSAVSPKDGPLGAADWLLAAIWILEWIANTYVWVVIVGFLDATMHALGKHPFRDGVVRILRERQYRPFLLMSAHGATIVLLFAAASVLYLLYASGDLSDYVGLAATVGLLLAGFVPPWIRLRSKIAALVHAETERLGRGAEMEIAHEAGPRGELPVPRTVEALGEQMHVVVAFLRVEHLERLFADLGKMEAQAVFVRLLAPIATIVWRFTRG
jgi:hypothetical protein